MDSDEVSIQMKFPSVTNLYGTIPLPPYGHTQNPSAMTPHCTTSHCITTRWTALCITRIHEFFAGVLLKVKSRMELVAEKLVATNLLN